MALPLSERLTCLRDDARRIMESARGHEDDLNGLLRTSERAVRQATELSRALTDGDRSTGDLRRLCSEQLAESIDNAGAAHRACVGGREQSIAARRLLTRIDTDTAEEEMGEAGRPTAVLVVDDSVDLREMVADVLREAGFLVRTAANGLDALLVAYEMKPAVIVMDVTMPVLDGFEATRLIKAADGLRQAKVIAYTGNTSMPNAWVEGWFADIVPKPSTPDVVLAAVQRAVGERASG